MKNSCVPSMRLQGILFKACKIICFPTSQFRLDNLLKEAEKRHHITCRWSESDPVYIQVHQMFSEERKVQIGKALWAASATRQFLLDLKAKYAGECVYALSCATCTFT